MVLYFRIQILVPGFYIQLAVIFYSFLLLHSIGKNNTVRFHMDILPLEVHLLIV